MATTITDIIEYVKKNGVNGSLTIEERGTEEVVVGYNEDGKPITEIHDFKYTSVFIQREDLTASRARLQAQLDATL